MLELADKDEISYCVCNPYVPEVRGKNWLKLSITNRAAL